MMMHDAHDASPYRRNSFINHFQPRFFYIYCILINMYLHWFVLTFIYIMMYSIEIIYLDITYKRYKQ